MLRQIHVLFNFPNDHTNILQTTWSSRFNDVMSVYETRTSTIRRCGSELLLSCEIN